MFFHQGAPRLGEGALRSEQGLARLRSAAAAHLSPAGQLQVAAALEVIDGLEARLHAVRHQLLDAARHLRTLLAEGRLPECWVPPAQILECRALLETYHDLRAGHTAQAQLRGVLSPGCARAG